MLKLSTHPLARSRASAWLCLGFAVCVMGTTATWSAVGQAAGVSVNDATIRDKARAKGPYSKAMEAFDDGNFEAALQGFQESYDIVASPNSHLMIVRTLAKLGLTAEAYSMLHDVITEAEAAQNTDKYGKTADAARAEQEQLRSRLALVTIDMAAGAVINGQLIPPMDFETLIEYGHRLAALFVALLVEAEAVQIQHRIGTGEVRVFLQDLLVDLQIL